MTAPARSVENLGRNLRALIQQLVVETRKAKFNPNSPETQNLLKKFASQAHNYQVAARNAGKKFNKAAAEANIKKNNAAAEANAAAAAAAANVGSAAAEATKAARANSTPSALRVRLTALKNKAAAAIRNLKTPKPVAPPPSALNISNVNKYFASQPSSAQVNANKRARGATKGVMGRWTYPSTTPFTAQVAEFWKKYNTKNKNIENIARTRNFTRYIALGRNTNKNIAKYPKYGQFFKNTTALKNLNAKRNELITRAVASDPASIEGYKKEITNLMNTYRTTYKGYTPANISIQRLNKKSYDVVNQKAKNANRESFARAIAGGLKSYAAAVPSRNLKINRSRYGVRPYPPDFVAFWTEVAAANLDKAKAKAENAANRAMKNNATVNTATAASVEAKAALAEANLLFKNTNQKRTAVLALQATRDAASGAAQGLVLTKKRVEAAAKAAAAAQAAVNKAKREAEAAAVKAAANAQKVEAARVAAAAKAVENRSKANAAEKAAKVKAIAKALANLQSTRNSASRKAKQGDVAEVTKLKNSANRLKTSVNTNTSGANANQRNTAIRLAGETAAYIDVAKHVKFIQEVWSRTRGSGVGNAWRVKKGVTQAELTPIIRKYFNKNSLSNNNKKKINNLIPVNSSSVKSGSIIGWQGGLIQRRDANYNTRKNYLKQILNINQTPAAAAPPPPPAAPPLQPASSGGPTRSTGVLKTARLRKIQNNLTNKFVTGAADPMINASYAGLNKENLKGLTPAEIKAYLNSLANFKNTGTKAFNNAARQRMTNYFQ